MRTPRSISAIAGEGFLRLEHLTRRRVIRIAIRPSPRAAAESTEMSVDDFVDQLGLAQQRAPACPRFLIFAGADGRQSGGAGDFVAAFPSEEEARNAFRHICQHAAADWAQLVCLGDNGRLRTLCWKGTRAGRPPRVPYVPTALHTSRAIGPPTSRTRPAPTRP